MAESSEDSFFKFPRTRHLFDAGGSGVSRDDLLMDSSEEKVFYTTRQHQVLVAVEEKVDGANLGVSIGHDMKLYVQNRAHYINSTTHRQFSTLDNWCATHSSELYDILIPGKHVLFGEWLYAKHSVHYKELPGYFIAFDVYDKEVSKFYSRRERNKMLENTSIPIIRLIEETNLVDRQQIKKLLETRSNYYDGPCEGLYLRIDDDTNPYLSRRAKLVRPDFMQQIEEQWTRQQFTKNIVRF